MTELYTGTQCAAFDQLALTQWGFSADQLMARAGEFAWQALQQRWPQAQRLCVCAGVGNNAGDGYVVARLAQQQAWSVVVLQLEGRRLSGAAGRAQALAEQAGVQVIDIQSGDLAQTTIQREMAQAQVLVDAILGIGLASAPRAGAAQMIAALNVTRAEHGAGVLALDVPSGLNADTGAAFDTVVHADLTATFIVDKVALRTGAGRALAGEVRVSHLGISARRLRSASAVPCVRVDDVSLPGLRADAYKHSRGHVVVVGGDAGMSGAVLLTAEAALRSGAGLVSVITRGAASAGMVSRMPELMVVDAARWPAVMELLGKATVVVCGPGLGQAAWGRQLLAAVLSPGIPALRVLDADALNLLATPAFDLRAAAGAVVTPHSGEAARLLGCTSAQVEADRLAAAVDLAASCAGVAVLKGPGTVVAQEQQCSVCAHGNAGMASAGMGDVLAGVVGGLLAQLPAADRDHASQQLAMVRAAVSLHSAAADAAADVVGMRALVATDVITQIAPTLARCRGQGVG